MLNKERYMKSSLSDQSVENLRSAKGREDWNDMVKVEFKVKYFI